MKVRDWVTKRVFVEMKTPDGWTTVPVVHKSVVLENGTTIRWNKRGGCWSITSAPRWNSAVATSLSRYAMVAAGAGGPPEVTDANRRSIEIQVGNKKGRLQSDRESYHAFSNFQTRMATLVDVETFLEIVNFLK